MRILISRKLDLIDRKEISINLVSIEYQSSQADLNLNIYCIFNWLSYSFDQSKIWKTQILGKTEQFRVHLDAAYFVEKWKLKTL